MNKLVWRNIGRFALLMGFQLLVLNNVYLGGYVLPMLYVLFVLMLPTNMGRIPLLLAAFGTGLVADIASNVLGFHALACTVVAMLRIWFADRILTRGEPVVIDNPSVHTVTPQYMISYMLLMYGVFYLVYFVCELFGSRGFGDMLIATVLSSVVSTLLAVLYQTLFLKREKS